VAHINYFHANFPPTLIGLLSLFCYLEVFSHNLKVTKSFEHYISKVDVTNLVAYLSHIPQFEMVCGLVWLKVDGS
jgi:hypothetical protein